MLGSNRPDQNFIYYGVEKMTENTGQDRPSILGFNATYPPQNQGFEWNRTDTPPYILGANGMSPPLAPQQFQGDSPHIPMSMYPTMQFGVPSPNLSSQRQPQGSFASQHRTMMRCKRKTDSPPLQPVKQLITEEKMAEHMSKLQINSETAPHSTETDKEKTLRLYMCEQMRQLQTEPIIPQSLLATIRQPCRALVLWEPPQQRLFQHHHFQDTDAGNNNEESVPDNNAPQGLDNNAMDMDNL